MTGDQKIRERGINVVADELDVLQAKKNEGRGVSCVRTMITYLRRGEINLALAVRQVDGDKTRSYPDIEQFLNDNFGCRLHGKVDCEVDWCGNLT